jgi:hypothetical protein
MNLRHFKSLVSILKFEQAGWQRPASFYSLSRWLGFA